MPLWFYISEGRELGPLKGSELLERVRDQTITQTTLVRKDESAWFPAGEVGGLFAAASKPTVEYNCPDCGSTVSKPPCYCRKCRRALDYARPKFIEHNVEGFERPQEKRDTKTESWKQWVRKLKFQRDERLGGGPPRP